MKKFFTLAIALTVFASIANAQEKVMKVNYADGRTFDYEISRVGNVTFGDSDWESLGMCEYTDDFMTSLWNVEPCTYEVEIQKSLVEEDVYRLVNPYGAAYPENDADDWDGENHYMIIDAHRPTDGVYITYYCKTGLDWGYGEVYMTSQAAYWMDQGYSLWYERQMGDCGSLVDGVITFPNDRLLIMAPFFTTSTGHHWVDANINGAFKIVLPEARASAPTQPTSVVKEKSLEGHTLRSDIKEWNPER